MDLPDDAELYWLDADAGPVVRPYAMTGGRTEAKGDFDFISLIVTTGAAPPADTALGPEHLAILRLCGRPTSVAEVAAHLDLPVGIVRVLLGDLLGRALIGARGPEPVAEAPRDDFFEAVINGIRAL